MIADSTHAMLGDGFITRPVDRLLVKGKEHPVEVHELLATGRQATEEMRRMAKAHKDGHGLYLQRRFKEAIVEFENALGVHPENALARRSIERCQSFIADPPPDGWNGVYMLRAR